ncbi:F0F1 ATP synthase subunit delta [Cysteiniphilum sp. QT6929]|uniref:F0F1 ATP synthase subunit delta n=1 Tax=Cysteiniphilum TaxID=2056696 RepID=UPI0024B3621E|nr:F0F1 ATP synthase subunit delta [Cysteiniphilum sp. QT6929]WHN65133.1 F0F1 ATP synthase subunit delta [Cysteiniphilum sp. QT6929]
MADLTPIARPYAQAAYEYAKAHNAVANWNIMLLNLSECVTDNQVALLLDNPAYSQSDVSVLIFDVLKDVLDEHGKNFVKLAAEHNRLTVIPTIYKLFLLHKAEDEKAKKAKITTAFETSDAEIQKLKTKLEQKYQCAIEIDVAVDASLIGGATIEIGDHIIDGSIKGKLQKLQHELQA